MWPFRRNGASAVRSSEAYWLLRNGIGDASRRSSESIDCDIAIIGAGITAALVADALIATGQANRRARFARHRARQHLGIHGAAAIRNRHAPRRARADAGRGRRDARVSRLRRELLDCSSSDSPSCCRSRATSAARVCTWLRMRRRFRRCARSWRRAADIGLACEWLESEALRGRFGCQRPGAILSALGAQVDPFRLTRGAVRRLPCAMACGCSRGRR